MVTKYKSKLERDFAATYKLPYETARLPYTVVHQYHPDWTVSPTAFVETKGLFTGSDRGKHLQIQKQHPHVRVLLVFQNPQRTLSRASKTTYAMWCENHNIPWCAATDTTTITKFIKDNKQ